jgi:succinate dehydrogenase hydrophobic anchor subunit
MAPSYQSLKMPGTRYLQSLARARGWPYIGAWAHRISGVMLVLYAGLHIMTLASLRTPELFEQKMNLFAALMPGFIEWFLAVPVIYHALNGGRLILYELFGNRNEQLLLRWVLRLSSVYLLLLAVFMLLGNQTVSPILFWAYCGSVSLFITYLTLARLRGSGISLGWKLQRITAAFLHFMIPAHMLFMHLDPVIGRDVQVIIERMNHGLIRLIDLALLITLLYHAAYGILGICRDYVISPRLQRTCSIIVTTAALLLGWIGLKLTILI